MAKGQLVIRECRTERKVAAFIRNLVKSGFSARISWKGHHEIRPRLGVSRSFIAERVVVIDYSKGGA